MWRCIAIGCLGLFVLYGCETSDDGGGGNGAVGHCEPSVAATTCAGDCAFDPASIDCTAACDNIAAICGTSACGVQCEGQVTDPTLCGAACQGSRTLHCSNLAFGCYATSTDCGAVEACVAANQDANLSSTGGEDTSGGADTGGGGSGTCWEAPPYPQDMQPEGPSHITATAHIDPDLTIEFHCVDEEISYRYSPDTGRYDINCNRDDGWNLALGFPDEVGSWSYSIQEPDRTVGIGFTGTTNKFHAWASSDSGAEQGSLDVTAYDDCTKSVTGSFQATYTAIEALEKPAADIEGTFDLQM